MVGGAAENGRFVRPGVFYALKEAGITAVNEVRLAQFIGQYPMKTAQNPDTHKAVGSAKAVGFDRLNQLPRELLRKVNFSVIRKPHH